MSQDDKDQDQGSGEHDRVPAPGPEHAGSVPPGPAATPPGASLMPASGSIPPFAPYAPRPSFFPEESAEQSQAFADQLQPSLRPPPERPHSYATDSGLYATRGMRTLGPEDSAEEASSVTLFEPDGAAAVGSITMRPSLRPHLMSSLLGDRERHSDEGAAAALRTLPRRNRRDALMPLVGAGLEVEAARLRLLGHLADRQSGVRRARLLVAAAELYARRGQAQQARDAHENAYAADPADVLVLRRHLHDSLRDRNFERCGILLQQLSAAPVSVEERAFALCADAELHRDRAPARARQAIADALRLHPASLSATLLHAEFSWKAGALTECADTLAHSADHQPNSVTRASLLLQAGRLLEHRRDHGRALAAYSRASVAAPSHWSTVLGVYRACRAMRDLDGAQQALARLAELETDAAMRDGLLRKRALLLHMGLGRPADALALLGHTRRLTGIRQRVRAAQALGHAQAEFDALSIWVETGAGSERALALVELARFYSLRNQRDDALRALREASLAGAPRGLVGLLQEALARDVGDSAALARAAQDEDAGSTLRAAAKLAMDATESSTELMLLVRASAGHEHAVCAELLSLDAAASATDLAYVTAGLRSLATRLPTVDRVGLHLALLDLSDDPAASDAVLEVMQRDAVRDVAALRSAATRERDSLRAAHAWRTEAACAEGERAAFAATMAGRCIEAAGHDPIDAYLEALDATYGYAPAAYALELAARRRGHLLGLQRALAELADSASACIERSARHVRLALLAADGDAAAAVTYMQRATLDRPMDPLLAELHIRLCADAPPRQRAELFVAAAELESTPDFRRALRLRAASAYEDAEQWGAALDTFRSMLEADASDASAACGRVVVLQRIGDYDALIADTETHMLEAATREQRISALERLAELELRRGARKRARSALQNILESDPTSSYALRGLQRLSWDDRDAELELAAASLAADHARLPAERASQLRLWLRLGDQNGDGDAALRACTSDAPRTELLCALRMEAHAMRSGESARMFEALLCVARRLDAPLERAAYAVRAATMAGTVSAEHALTELRDALAGDEQHPLAAEELGRLQRAARDARGAVETFLRAADASSTATQRKARLLHAAAVLLQDELREPERAAAVFAQVVEIDVLFADTFARLRALLDASGDAAALLQLLSHRLAAPIDAAAAAELQEERARLLLAAGDTNGAALALQAALEEDPTHVSTLRRLAELQQHNQAFRDAADTLVKLARVTADPETLAHAFFELGLLYAGPLADPRRAEIAFTRVVSLSPADRRPIEHLVRLWLAQNDTQRALRALQHLVSVAADGDARQRYVVELAAALESSGEGREAERVLEAERRTSPASLPVLRALSGLYERQQDRSALAMHLARCCHALRTAIEQTPADAALWLGLIEFLRARGRQDAATAVAAAALALGHETAELHASPMTALPDAATSDAALRKLHAYTSLDTLRALLHALPPEVVTLFSGPAHDDSPMLADDSRASASVARLFGLHQLQMRGTDKPGVCTPLHGIQLSVLVHAETFEHATEAERMFLLGRAAAAARHGHSLLLSASLDQLLVFVHALRRLYAPQHTVAAVDVDELSAVTKQLSTALSADDQLRLELLVNDLFADGDVNPRKLAAQALDLGSRIMLCATGDIRSAFDALWRLRGRSDDDGLDARASAAKIDMHLRALLSFAVSESYVDARRDASSPPTSEAG